MTKSEILQPLLQKGDLKKTLSFAAEQNIPLLELEKNGINVVTASILATVAPLQKMNLIRQVGMLFSPEEYCELINQKIFQLHPQKEAELRDEGIALTEENIKKYSDKHSVFSLAFPPLPLSIFEDMVEYLHEEKNLVLDAETIEIVKQNYLLSYKYSPREIEAVFENNPLLE